MLFAILRPGEAKAASVYADSVKLAFGSYSSTIALGHPPVAVLAGAEDVLDSPLLKRRLHL